MARSGLVALVAVVLGTAAASSMAGQIEISDPGLGWRANGFNGGAFQITPLSGQVGPVGGPGPSPLTSFLSFCLERNEGLGALPRTYYADTGMVAIAGGIGGGSPDPLDVATAFLYWSFRNEVPIDGDVVSNADEARSLQRAIWRIEDELDGTETEWLNDSRAQDYYDFATDPANHQNNFRGVAVLRLWNASNPITGVYSDHRQDQLTLIPLPPTAWAGIGSLVGVMAFGYVRRRKQLS
jgi:hypothetical protein